MRTIRAAEPARRVVMLAVTASVFAEDEARLVQAGADQVIGKPVAHDQLLAALAAGLGLEYAYAEQDAAAADTPATAVDLRGLPRELLTALQEATVSGRLRLLDELVERAAAVDPAAAVLLGELVAAFDYDRLSELLEEALS